MVAAGAVKGLGHVSGQSIDAAVAFGGLAYRRLARLIHQPHALAVLLLQPLSCSSHHRGADARNGSAPLLQRT